MDEKDKIVLHEGEPKTPAIQNEEQFVYRKKTTGEKAVQVFFGEKAKKVGNYVWTDVVLPAIKDTLFDIISGGASILLFDDSRHSSGRRRISSSPSSTYTSYSSTSRANRLESTSRASRTTVSNREDELIDIVEDYCFVFYNQHTALDVLCDVDEYVSTYPSISVQDLYSIIKNQCSSDRNSSQLIPNFTDLKLGWDAEELKGIRPRHVKEGWMIDLPKPHGID